MKTCPTCQSTYPDTTAFCARDGSELKVTTQWLPGAVVRGRYRILSKIGEGGMAAVYKATHTGFDELRAIKVLNADLASDSTFHQRFKKEAYITRKLSHPNAVRVEDIDEAEDGCLFIVMEYIEGKSLTRVIKAEGPLPARRVCLIAQQVAAALDAAHKIGMVHRDIKPDNIVLVQTPLGEVAKVLDFGIASLREGGGKGAPKSVDLTGSGFVVGTPTYLSPEQAQGRRGEDLDGRSDLYSLGVVMYQMLTGDVPFKSDTAIELMIAHVQTPPPPINTVRPELSIPEPLAALVMRMLQKDRDLRPRSAAVLIEELTRIEKLILDHGALTATPRAAPARPHDTVVAAAATTVLLRPPAAATVLPRPPAPATVLSRPPANAPPVAARPAAVVDEVPPFYRRPSVILIAVAFVASAIWYHATHRPGDLVARHQQAAAELEIRQLYPQAEEEYREAAQIDSNNAAIQSALGHVLMEERKWDEAIAALRQAITLQPDNAVAHNNLGVALQTAGNSADAVTEFREAARLQPDYVEAHANLGSALAKQNDFSGSIAAYKEVMRLKPDDADAHFHIGLADYKLGNSDGAVDEYREAIRLQPGFALAHFSLGGVLYNRGEHEAGIEELRTAYSLSPEDPEIRAAYQKVLEQ